MSASANNSSSSRRRDKPILSCSFCRGRKLRCDRQSPCGACVRRSKPEECVYLSSEQERKDAIDYRPPHARNPKTPQARQRVARLERLVTEMMVQSNQQQQQQQQQTQQSVRNESSTPGSDPPGVSPASSDSKEPPHMGSLSLDDGHASYTGSTHWTTILEDIHRLKEELPDDQSESTLSPEAPDLDAEPEHEHGPTRISLLNSGPCLSREQIMAAMPPRKVVDRHVSHFFNSFDVAPFILSRSRFFAEYANFWQDPSAVPISWVGLLYSLMTTSAFLQQSSDPTTPSQSPDTLENFRTLTIQCLINSDYLRPSRYTIETLTLHFGVDQNVNIDTYLGNWILIGIIIRIALRTGLHRDPSHWPNMRPLQAELRRRLWTMLYHMDFFTSTQVGLPRIIKDAQCDTRPPRHLLENDLGFEHVDMPPERSATSPTPLLYIIQRDNIIRVSAEIYDATDAASSSTSSIAALSAKLDNAIMSIPPWLRTNSMQTTLGEDPRMALNRTFLDILVQKATYLLHRRSFVEGSPGEENLRSNELCIQAALAILGHQKRVEEETAPGGLMAGVRWKVLSSLNHEFLQATMMLCFAYSKLDQRRTDRTDMSAADRKDAIQQALIIARDLWNKITDKSTEARRAAKAIATVMEKDAANFNPPIAHPSAAFFQPATQVDAFGNMESFDFGQDMALDPSFFNFDDLSSFGGMLDDYTSEQMQ